MRAICRLSALFLISILVQTAIIWAQGAPDITFMIPAQSGTPSGTLTSGGTSVISWTKNCESYRIWDEATANLIHTVDKVAGEGAIRVVSKNVDFAIKGQQLISKESLPDGALLAQTVLSVSATDAKMSPDESRIALVLVNKTIQIRKTSDLSLVRTFSNATGPVDWSMDCKNIVYFETTGLVAVSDASTGALVVHTNIGTGVRSVAFVPNTDYLAIGVQTSFEVWKLVPTQRIKQTTLPNIKQIRTTPDLKKLFVVGDKLSIYSVPDLNPVQTISALGTAFFRSEVNFSSDGSKFFVGDTECQLEEFSSADGTFLKSFGTLGDQWNFGKWSPDGSKILASAGNLTQTYRASSSSLLRNYYTYGDFSNSADWDDNGNIFVVARPNLDKWNTISGGLVSRYSFFKPGLKSDVKPVRLVCIPSRDKIIVEWFTGSNSLLVCHSATTGQVLWWTSRKNLPSLQRLEASPDGQYVATSDSTTTLTLISPDDGHIIKTIPGVGNPTTMSFSRDSKQLAVGTLSGTINIFDCSSWDRLNLLSAGDVPTALSFSPDGKRLAFGIQPNVVRITDLTNTASSVFFDQECYQPRSVEFSPDGETLLVTRADGAIFGMKAPQ